MSGTKKRACAEIRTERQGSGLGECPQLGQGQKEGKGTEFGEVTAELTRDTSLRMF